MQVKFRIKKAETIFGQQVKVIGNIPELGNWNVNELVHLQVKQA